MFTSDFNLAQDLYLASSCPIAALEVFIYLFIEVFFQVNAGIFYLLIILSFYGFDLAIVWLESETSLNWKGSTWIIKSSS